MNTVDVVVPCYNYGRFLDGCTKTVLSQSGVQVRLLILDDASSDDTPVIARTLAAADDRITYRRHEVNKGHIATYNEGLIDWSRAEYTVLLSADDLMSPGALARAVTVMEEHPNVGLVYGSTVRFNEESSLPKSTSDRYGVHIWSGGDWLERRCEAGYNVITSPEVVVRGSVQRAVGGYRTDLPHAGDLEMWLRIAAVSDIAYIKGPPQAYYRVHAKSMMRSVFNRSVLDLRQRRDAFDSFIRHSQFLLSNPEALREQAHRSLAREALWDACRAYDHDQVTSRGAEELVDFACETFSEATSLPEYAALRRRKRLGAVLCRRTQIFGLSAAVRRLRHSAEKRRWQSQGV